MKRISIWFIVLLLASLLGGCTIHVRTIVPDEQGNIFDWFKKDPPAVESPEKPEAPLSTKPNIPEPLPNEEKGSTTGNPAIEKDTTPPISSTSTIFKVTITPEKPSKDGYVTLSVQGPANTPYTATFHFRTRDSIIQGYCGMPFQVLLGGATIGYVVKVDVTALIDGQVQRASASFTPQ